MSVESFREIAWENFCTKTHGWTRYWGENGRFDLFVTIPEKDVGEPFPLTIRYGPLFLNNIDDKNLRNWNIPERSAQIGVYLGRKMAYKGQKRPKIVFATPTQNGRYRLFVAHSGIVDWHGGGDDEPCQQSGIRTDSLCVTGPENTEAITSRFGDKFSRYIALLERAS